MDLVNPQQVYISICGGKTPFQVISSPKAEPLYCNGYPPFPCLPNQLFLHEAIKSCSPEAEKVELIVDHSESISSVIINLQQANVIIN